MHDKHYKGFEKERQFHIILGLALRDCPILQARTVKAIIGHVATDFLEGLFERRPCVRKLKYIGCGCEESVCPHGAGFFKIGKVYESIDFTGATYTIKGYKNDMARIGSRHFEWID